MERLLAECEAESARQAEAARAGHARAARLEGELERTGEARRRDAEELGRLRGDLELHRSHYDEQMRGLAALGAQLEELRVTARGQATRIRLRALREAAELSLRSEELRRAPKGADERLVAAVEAAIARIGTQWDSDADGERGEALSARPASARPESQLSGEKRRNSRRNSPLGAYGNGNGLAGDDGDGEGEGRAGGRRVSVDVGPFDDFSQLVRFEDAANAIDGAGEISIRRFSGGRASIDVSLSEPVDLLRELEQRCDLDFRVRHNGGDEIVLDVSE